MSIKKENKWNKRKFVYKKRKETKTMKKLIKDMRGQFNSIESAKSTCND